MKNFIKCLNPHEMSPNFVSFRCLDHGMQILFWCFFCKIQSDQNKSPFWIIWLVYSIGCIVFYEIAQCLIRKKNHQTSGFKTFIISSNINPISIRILSESPWNLFRSGPSNGCSPGILLYLGWRRGHTGCTKWFLYTKKQNNYINYMMEKDNGFPSCFFVYHYYHLVL